MAIQVVISDDGDVTQVLHIERLTTDGPDKSSQDVYRTVLQGLLPLGFPISVALFALASVLAGAGFWSLAMGN